MSRVLCDAVIRSLKEAHQAYLSQKPDKYRECMKVAECGIDAIRSLGTDHGCAREMELMGLQAELTLLRSLEYLNRPAEMIPLLESAQMQMLMPPSKVISKEDPVIAEGVDLKKFFAEASVKGLGELTKAMELYSQLTGGGGAGLLGQYRAQMAENPGD